MLCALAPFVWQQPFKNLKVWIAGDMKGLIKIREPYFAWQGVKNPYNAEVQDGMQW